MKNTAEYSSVNGINGNANRSSKTRAAIIILALLLALSVCGLAARYIYLAFFAEGRDTVTVPDNLIGKTESASVGTGSLLPAAGIRFLLSACFRTPEGSISVLSYHSRSESSHSLSDHRNWQSCTGCSAHPDLTLSGFRFQESSST